MSVSLSRKDPLITIPKIPSEIKRVKQLLLWLQVLPIYSIRPRMSLYRSKLCLDRLGFRFCLTFLKETFFGVGVYFVLSLDIL